MWIPCLLVTWLSKNWHHCHYASAQGRKGCTAHGQPGEKPKLKIGSMVSTAYMLLYIIIVSQDTVCRILLSQGPPVVMPWALTFLGSPSHLFPAESLPGPQTWTFWLVKSVSYSTWLWVPGRILLLPEHSLQSNHNSWVPVPWIRPWLND